MMLQLTFNFEGLDVATILSISRVFIILILLFSLPVGIGCILAAFKTNQLALLSNECPSISPSEPRLRGKEGFLGGSKEGAQRAIIPRSIYLL